MMNNKKFCFITCVNNEEFYSECLYYINNLNIPEGYEVEILSIENAESITSGYNNAMRSSDAKYKIYLDQVPLLIYKNMLFEIIDKYMVNKVKVLNSLAIMFFNSRIDDRVLFYLNNSLEIAEDKDDTLYYLGYILSIYGEKKLALDYLEQIKNKSENVNDLIIEIKG